MRLTVASVLKSNFLLRTLLMSSFWNVPSYCQRDVNIPDTFTL